MQLPVNSKIEANHVFAMIVSIVSIAALTCIGRLARLSNMCKCVATCSSGQIGKLNPCRAHLIGSAITSHRVVATSRHVTDSRWSHKSSTERPRRCGAHRPRFWCCRIPHDDTTVQPFDRLVSITDTFVSNFIVLNRERIQFCIHEPDHERVIFVEFLFRRCNCGRNVVRSGDSSSRISNETELSPYAERTRHSWFPQRNPPFGWVVHRTWCAFRLRKRQP